jgi:hypothetical protein
MIISRPTNSITIKIRGKIKLAVIKNRHEINPTIKPTTGKYGRVLENSPSLR